MEGEDPRGPGLGVAETVDVGHDPTTPSGPRGTPPPTTPTTASGAGPASTELPLVEPDRYEILGVHGRGGLGRILRARDRHTGRIVAIKEILHDNPAVIARFQREALVTANLQHPAIVPVYEVGRWPSGKPFYVMKLVVGATLAEAIEHAGSLTGRLALLPHAVQVAAALAYAHDQGWIHRDLKPANVLVGDFGETVVIDWGLARPRKAADGDALYALSRPPASKPPSLELPPSGDGGQDTQVGTVVGTPVYMAPEQARGETIDARADVYAIGALLYHVLGGVAPYRECRTASDVIAKVALVPPRPLAELAPELPPDLVAIVEHAMARDPEARYATAGELAIDLGRFQAGALVEAHRYTRGERMRRFVRRHRAAVAVSAIASVALIAVSAIAIRNVVVARDNAQAERGRAEAARGLAERESGAARRSLAALHRELGRAALAEGAPGRALPHLARALRSMHDDDAGVMRVAAGLAVDTLRGARGVIAAGGPVFGLAIENGRAVPSTMTSPQQVWDLEDGATHPVDGLYGRLSPDGRLITTRSADFTSIDVRRLDRGDRLATLSGDGLVFLEGFAGDDRVWVAFDGGAGDRRAGGRIRRWRITDDRVEPDADLRLPGVIHRVHVGAGGRWGIAAGSHGEVWRFDLDRGAVTVLDPGGPDRAEVAHVRALGDEAQVAAFSTDGVIRLWRTGAATPRTITGADAATPPAFTRDGRYAALWSPRLGVRVLDTAAATIGPPFGEAGTGNTFVAITSTGRTVATGNADGEVAVWTAADGTQVAAGPGHADAVTAIGFAADDRTVISAAASGDVRAWRSDAASRQLGIHHDGRVWDGAFVADDRVVTVGADHLGRITGTDGAAIAVLSGHDDAITGVSETSGLIGTCARDGSARLWAPDGHPGPVLGSPGSPGVACSIAIAPTGARVAVARDTEVSIFHLNGTFERNVDAGGAVHALAWTADSARWLAVHDDGVSLWDAATGTQVATIDSHGAPIDVLISPDRDLAAIRTDGYEVAVVSTVDGATAYVAVLEQPMTALGWAPGGTLLVATRGGRLDQFAETGTRAASIHLGGDGPTAIAVRPDGALLAAGGMHGDLELWDRGTERLLARRAVGQPIVALRWAPDGNHLLIITTGTEATLLDLSPYRDDLDALDRLIRCRAPFQLADDRLVAATPPADCHPGHFAD